MSFFSSIGHFFEKLFGEDSTVVEKVLTSASSIVTLAEPVVAGIETELKTLPQTPTLQVIAAFLAKYMPEAQNVATEADGLSKLSGAALWQGIASTVLTYLSPAGTAASLINLAIELAYGVLKAKQPTTPAPAK